jgi:hypothetical protein
MCVKYGNGLKPYAPGARRDLFRQNVPPIFFFFFFYSGFFDVSSCGHVLSLKIYTYCCCCVCIYLYIEIYISSLFFAASLSLKASGNVIILWYHWCAGAGCLTTSTVLQNFLLLFLLFLRLRLIFIYLFLTFFLIILCNKITLGSWISCSIHTTLCPFR